MYFIANIVVHNIVERKFGFNTFYSYIDFNPEKLVELYHTDYCYLLLDIDDESFEVKDSEILLQFSSPNDRYERLLHLIIFMMHNDGALINKLSLKSIHIRSEKRRVILETTKYKSKFINEFVRIKRWSNGFLLPEVSVFEESRIGIKILVNNVYLMFCTTYVDDKWHVVLNDEICKDFKLAELIYLSWGSASIVNRIVFRAVTVLGVSNGLLVLSCNIEFSYHITEEIKTRSVNTLVLIDIRNCESYFDVTFISPYFIKTDVDEETLSSKDNDRAVKDFTFKKRVSSVEAYKEYAEIILNN